LGLLLVGPIYAGDPANLVIEVTDAQGRPLAGALVTVDGLPAGRTDDGGRFVQEGREAGRILSIGVHGAHGEGETVQPVRLVPGSQRHVLAVEWTPRSDVVPPREIWVEVLDGDGFPVADTPVRVAGEAVGRTDASGRVLAAVTPGVGVVTVEAPVPGDPWL